MDYEELETLIYIKSEYFDNIVYEENLKNIKYENQIVKDESS